MTFTGIALDRKTKTFLLVSRPMPLSEEQPCSWALAERTHLARHSGLKTVFWTRRPRMLTRTLSRTSKPGARAGTWASKIPTATSSSCTKPRPKSYREERGMGWRDCSVAKSTGHSRLFFQKNLAQVQAPMWLLTMVCNCSSWIQCLLWPLGIILLCIK